MLAGWSIWDHFDPPGLVKAGLLLASAWLIVAGMVLQLVPDRRATGARKPG